MNLPAGYALRPPIADDLLPVAEVLAADQRQNGGEAVLDAHFIRQQWSRPGFDLAADAWVVTDDAGAIVGYGQVRLAELDAVGSWGVVHPEHRGHGIGSMLFDRIESRASDLLAGVASPRLQHSISAGDRAAESILAARGLRPIRHFWHMQVDFTGTIEGRPALPGIELHVVDPIGDLRAVHAILVEAFTEDPSGQPPPFDEWADEELGNPSYDPALWLLARDAGRPVGALIASAGDEAGWVDWLAVLASHRGRGIGATLLQHSFAVFTDRGVRRVRLNVDAESPTATALYERAGMRVVNRWELWERQGY